MYINILLGALTIGEGSARPGGDGGGSQRSQIRLPGYPVLEYAKTAPKRPVSHTYLLLKCQKRPLETQQFQSPYLPSPPPVMVWRLGKLRGRSGGGCILHLVYIQDKPYLPFL
jgi:hypothetical protein